MPGNTKTSRSADSVEKVYDVVKTMAVDYHFKPGERVNEVELASRLGVSRTPVREALNRLARDGFMNFVPNRGFYSRDITPSGVQELYEMRAILEQASFRFACRRATDDEINQAVAIWESACESLPAPSQITNWAPVAELDEEFHMAIASIAHNSRLFEALDSLNSHIRFFRRIDLETTERRDDAYVEHIEIIAALRERNEEKGMKLMEKHVSLSAEHAINVTKEGLARIYFGR